MRVRSIAAGVALAALAGTVAPIALSGTATAKGSGTPPVLAVTKCSPKTATIGKSVTIHGTLLTGATKVTIGAKNVTADIVSNTAKAIKISPVPSGIATASPATVKVTTSAGTASLGCQFKKAPKPKKHHKK